LLVWIWANILNNLNNCRLDHRQVNTKPHCYKKLVLEEQACIKNKTNLSQTTQPMIRYYFIYKPIIKWINKTKGKTVWRADAK